MSAEQFRCILRDGGDDISPQIVFFGDDYTKGVAAVEKLCPRGTIVEKWGWDDEIVVDYKKFQSCGCAVFEQLGRNYLMLNTRLN